MVDMTAVEAVFDWLCDGAPPPTGIRHSLRTGLERMRAAGVPIDRFALFILMIHPMIAGRRMTWSPGGEVEVLEAAHGFFQSDTYLNSPIRVVYDTGRPLRRRFCDTEGPDPYPDWNDMRAEGYTDALALPLKMATGKVYGVSWATRAPGGFSDDAIRALERINPPVARLIETYVLRLNTETLLSTYVGRNAGPRVLAGRILRGDAEAIEAVILFADVKNFTAMSNARPAPEVIAVLNRFFDALDDSITARGGEILKFMGDGALAIFPLPPPGAGRRAAAARAREAVRATRDRLAEAPDPPGFRAALHLGEVHYGNIGAGARLDFTAIGPAVNLAARLLSAAAGAGADVVCSAAFAEVCPDGAREAGAVALKGFDGPQPLYALA